MSYTPINWQTGDTITAEKLNKMDNGWGVENTQLFSETVTTVYNEGITSGTLAYSGVLDSDVLTVTFNGTDYSCPRIELYGITFYGGFTEQGPDFSEYPFAIQSAEGQNDIFTENAGTYTVAASGTGTVVSANFANAVAMATPEHDFEIILGTTTWAEADAAFRQGKNVYYYVGSTSQKSIILLSSVTDAYRLCGVSIANHSANAPYITVLTATSEDGVLS